VVVVVRHSAERYVYSRPVVRPLAMLAAAALAVPAAALGGTPVAEIRGPDGTVLAAAARTPFSYPADGSVLRIGAARPTAAGFELRDVSVLAGRARAARLLVPAHGAAGAAADGLVVNGRAERATTNAVLSLGGPSYLVVLQEAVVPGLGTGAVGLRAYVGTAQRGLPAGSQILVGLARADVPSPQAESEPYHVLGVPSLPGQVTMLPGVLDPFAALQGPSPVGVRAVALAQQFLGVPYVWGGADPTGFDCSGLVLFVYRQLGIGLPHFSGSQWYSGARVPLDDLAPGDLVFFDMGRNGPGHVGIYVGDGKFIEAPHHDAVVRISSLFDPARGLSYVGAVRPY
jgi:hypothetical protein